MGRVARGDLALFFLCVKTYLSNLGLTQMISTGCWTRDLGSWPSGRLPALMVEYVCQYPIPKSQTQPSLLLDTRFCTWSRLIRGGLVLSWVFEAAPLQRSIAGSMS